MYKYIIEKVAVLNFLYNVQILTSADGVNYYYAGTGIFCETYAAAIRYIYAHKQKISARPAVFETGKTYHVNGPGTITIISRSRDYVTYSGDIVGNGRKRIYKDNLFNKGEYILISCGKLKYYCFAG